MDEKDEYNTPNTPDNIAKIVVFAIIGLIVVTSVALPILAGLGIENHTVDNNGVRVSRMTAEKWDSLISQYDDSTAVTLSLSSSMGMYLTGRINGVWSNEYLVSMDDFDYRYPIWIKYSFGSSLNVGLNGEKVISYDMNISRFTMTSLIQTSNFDMISEELSNVNLDTLHFWYQDPEGDHVMNTGNMNIISDPVEGFRMSLGSLVVSDTTQAKYTTVESEHITNEEFGTPIIEKESHANYTTIESMSFRGVVCQYYIGPISYSYTEDTLANTPIGTMIGIIPLLMIIGVVLFVVKQFKRSDR